MKGLLFVCLLLPFFCLAQANQKINPNNVGPAPRLSDLVIGVPNLKIDELGRVKTSLKTLDGVTWEGYCEDQHYILLKVDRSVQDYDNKKIVYAILSVKNNYKIYVMTKTISQAVNMCIDKEKVLSK